MTRKASRRAPRKGVQQSGDGGNNRARKAPPRGPVQSPEPRLAVAIAIGLQIRELRRKLGLTGVAVARRSGLSPGMLSKIENGNVMASMESLITLAKALNVSLPTLFANLDDTRPCTHVPAGKGQTITPRGGMNTGYRYQLLAHTVADGSVSELFLVTLTSRAKPRLFRRPGTEFIYLLSGRMLYRHGERTYLLAQGDVLSFDSASLHGPEELIEHPISYLSWRHIGQRETVGPESASYLATALPEAAE